MDLPRLRDDLIEFAHTDTAAELRTFAAEQQGVSPDAADVMLAPAPGLDRADLFYVTPEMCELAGTAARSLPEFALDADDPPSPSGLAWFAAPVEDIDSETERQPLHAVAVGWLVRGNRLWVTTYVDRDSFPWDAKVGAGDLVLPRVFPMGCWLAPLDEDGSAPVVDTVVGRAILSTTKTVWLLMRQPLAEVEPAAYDRASRRRLMREGQEPPAVRVISLRHPPGSGSGEGSGREWHHRWIVRGHWRMQAWGPGRERRRPVWISPFVKGPEGAPLLGGQKVYTVPARPGESVDLGRAS